MNFGAKGIKLLSHFEGRRNYAYNDPVGVCTVGVGHALKPHRRCTSRDYKLYGTKARPLTSNREVDRILRRDIEVFRVGVSRVVRRDTKQHEFDAMVSLAFNIGMGGFRSSTVLRQHNRRHGFRAGVAFGAWNKGTISGVLRVLAGLSRRRRAERRLYRKNRLNFA